MPAGRPSKYDPAFCERVIEYGAEGMSPAEIAGTLGTTRPTLYDWANKHPEFSTALTRAKALEQLWWEGKAREAIANGLEFNATVWKVSMQARFREDYTERKVLEGDPEKPLVPILNVGIGDQKSE